MIFFQRIHFTVDHLISFRMEIRFLGTGGAFQVELGNSAVLIKLDQGNLLVDCGHSVFPTLVKKGIIDEVDAVLLTHFHDDHVGSLSSLILYYQIVLKKGKLTLLSPSQEFEDELRAFLAHSLINPELRANFQSLDSWSSIHAIDTYGLHVAGMPTYAYTFSERGASLAYSGDLGNPDPFFSELDNMDLPNLQVFHEVCFTDNGSAHTFYTELERYLDRYTIYGYHCDHHAKPSDLRLPLAAEHGFLIK